jgi:hypothetical protein
MKNGVAVLGFLALIGCTQSTANVASSLAAYGFTHVQTDGWAPFACDSKEDQFATKFNAVNPQGQAVSGVVCAGLMKADTIRGLRLSASASPQ